MAGQLAHLPSDPERCPALQAPCKVLDVTRSRAHPGRGGGWAWRTAAPGYNPLALHAGNPVRQRYRSARTIAWDVDMSTVASVGPLRNECPCEMAPEVQGGGLDDQENGAERQAAAQDCVSRRHCQIRMGRRTIGCGGDGGGEDCQGEGSHWTLGVIGHRRAHLRRSSATLRRRDGVRHTQATIPGSPPWGPRPPLARAASFEECPTPGLPTCAEESRRGVLQTLDTANE